MISGLSRVTFNKHSTAQIAAEQKMDGSFGFCEAIQKHLTVTALTRMIGDDPYLYGRQIQKAFTWADKTDWSEAPEEKRKLEELQRK